MTPLTQDPKVIVLIDAIDDVAKVATNVAADIEVVVTSSSAVYQELAKGMPFNVDKS